MKLHTFVYAGIGFAVISLAACSGGPSESDIDKAVRTLLSNVIIDAESIQSVKKLGCQAPDGAGGYMCNVELEMKHPSMGVQKGVRSIRFVKGSDGWVAAVNN